MVRSRHEACVIREYQHHAMRKIDGIGDIVHSQDLEQNMLDQL